MSSKENTKLGKFFAKRSKNLKNLGNEVHWAADGAVNLVKTNPAS
jgi:hypothetical protein